MPYRRGRKSAAQTPAPRSERIKGSKKNPKGTAASQSSAAKIVLSDKTIKALSKKAKEYNKTHKSSVSLNTLKAVYRRGLGAYSSSHRPTITGGVPNTRNAWAMARVNKFLMKKAGKKVKAAYVQDDDLLARGGNVFDDKALLKRYKQGKSIGFSAEAHLKAKGLLPRADGTKRKSEKYKKTYAKRIAKTYSKGGSVLYHGSNLDIRYAEGGLIAPNGKPSNLTPEQYKLVRTPEFKAWFGDWENDPENASKVIDENGEPKVVSHSTRKLTDENGNYIDRNPIDVFEQSNYQFSTSKTTAKPIWFSYEGVYMDDKVYKEIINIKIFLNIRNLFDFNNKNQVKNLMSYANKNYSWADGINDVDFTTINYETIEAYRIPALIKEMGYDGYKTNEENAIVIFESEQAKLADGINKTFDPNNPDIRYAEGGLIAPNGKPSNLTPEQYKLVRTPEFKAWFGDWENEPKNASKVVDENGEPLVVYHGTSASFNTFKEEEKGRRGGLNEKFWSFTTNIEQAKIYALDNRVYGSFSTPRIIPAFLNIREMPTYDNQGKFYRELEVWGGYKHIDIFQLQDWHSRGFNMGVEFKEVDGFEVKNTIEMEERADLDKTLLIGNTYYVRNSNQIKLADGTNTTFDGSNPDIRFENGGETETFYNDDDIPYYKRKGALNVSYLNDEEWKLVTSPEFKQWFGDWQSEKPYSPKSKDVSQVRQWMYYGSYLGEPKIVYHASTDWAGKPYKDFFVFEHGHYSRDAGYFGKGFYFGVSESNVKQYGKYIRKFFLNIRNPYKHGFSVSDEGHPIEFAEELGLDHLLYAPDKYKQERPHPTKEFAQAVQDKLISLGYDGIHIDGKDGEQYVAFYPEQIKLADGTNTTFDANNPDVRFAKGGKIDKGQENFGQPPVPYSKILLIHEAPEENAIQIKKEGFRKPQNEIITKGVYTIPLAWKNKKFDDRPVSQELVITLKEGSKIFWSNSPRPTDFYIGYGNKFYENLFNELNKGYTSPRKSYTDENRSSYLRRFEKWLKNNGYVGVQQGGEIVITDYSAIDSIKSFTRKAEGGFDDEVIICSNCLWSWKLSETTPEEKYICHKCGHDNTPTMDKITMDVPLFIRLLEFAREDAKDDMELHTLTENALKLGDKTLTMQDYQEIVFSKTTSPKITKSTNSVVEFPTIEQEFSDGGVVVGKRHSESDENGTGEKFLVESTGQIVELEGGEGVLCKESMQSKKIYKFEGKEMTGREIASFLNHKYGGVEFAKGGQVDEKSVCGCRSMYYHGGELPSATLDSLKGGEAVVTVKTMESKDKFAFQGRQMTPRKILSHINQESGGKKFEDGGVIDLSEHHLKNLTKMVRMINFTEKIFYF
jgi:hypothetical protein